ncbi:MAG: HemY protein [Candidatus Tokpelaia sp. JSC161]|nr:MAG: HemY protein [Candidatus Tokpelaia sp. JSC161]
MLRLFLYLLLIALMSRGLVWLEDSQGYLVLTVQNTRMSVSLLTAVLAFFLSIVFILLLWTLLKNIFLSPVIFSRIWKRKNRERAYEALSIGLVSAFAGDMAGAQRMIDRSRKNLDNRDPLFLVLDGKLRLFNFDHKGAVNIFESMLNNPHTRLFGLRSLFLDALQRDAVEEAYQYAQEALSLNPSLKWATFKSLDMLARSREWKQALLLLNKFCKTQSKWGLKKENFLNHRVVLMIGQARDMFENYPDEARRIALKAYKLQPSFVPAINIAASILFRLQERPRGSRLIEKMWKVTPHPDLGFTYIGPETACGDKLERAHQLACINPENRESRMLVARAALEVGELAIARQNAESIADIDYTESTFYLLAQIERAQTGDPSRICQWLSRSVWAKADMAWVADSVALVEWQPLSPITGRLAVCQWRQQVRNVKQAIKETYVQNESEHDTQRRMKETGYDPLNVGKPMRSQISSPSLFSIVLDDPGISDTL